MKNCNKKSKAYQDAFYHVYQAAQLSGAYVMYYDIDFSKEELKEFMNKLLEHNHEELNHTITMKKLREFALEVYDFDSANQAASFPFRSRIKMTGIKSKPGIINELSVASMEAIEINTLLTAYTLKTDYDFSKELFMVWYNKFVEFCNLFAEGLTDAHLFEYFKKECGLTITEVD